MASTILLLVFVLSAVQACGNACYCYIQKACFRVLYNYVVLHLGNVAAASGTGRQAEGIHHAVYAYNALQAVECRRLTASWAETPGGTTHRG